MNDISILDLIPVGSENAILRNNLVKICVDLGLVEGKDADRKVRELISNARIDKPILNDGTGYYIPSIDDLVNVRNYIKRERSRALSILKSIKSAKALYEDLYHERFRKE